MSKITRRRFLAGGVAGGAAIAMAPGKKAFAATLEGFPEGMGVLVDMTRCVGCRTCEAACNKEQKLPEPEKSFDDYSVFDERHHGGEMRRTTESAYTVVNRYDPPDSDKPVYRKIQCNHCSEPACLTSCFVNAYTKTHEGAVIYKDKVCVGCRTCMVACPFGIPAYSYSSAFNPMIKKCIFCHETRLKQGLIPACVESCPQQVMTFGKRRELLKVAHDRIRRHSEKYIDYVYGENEVGGTGWLYLSNVPFQQAGFNTTLQKEPIINNVKDFLAIVPMVLAIWPALFTGFHLLATKGKSHGHGDEHSHDGQEEH